MTVSATSPNQYAPTSTSGELQQQTYTVERGDTLSKIAKQHGVSLNSLIAANPEITNPNLIYPDQSIRIPGGTADQNGAPAETAIVTSAGASYDGGPLSREELAQVFYQAGFRGENLVSMVAIAMRESRGNPDAYNGNSGTGDKSYGLVQINMIGNLGEARRAQLGLSSNEQLFDPLTNARAAYEISNDGTNLSPWGGYKGLSNTYGTDMDAARAAVNNAAAQGLLGQPFEYDGAPPLTSQTSSPAAPVNSAATQTSMPSLHIGARGESVKELQRELKAAGFNPGPVDGWFGPQTQAAVRKFQAANGLVIDGWVGKQTWGALKGHAGNGGIATLPAVNGLVPAVPGVNKAGVKKALDFGLSNLGAPYVGGASPFRFGDPGNGRVYQQQGQNPYVSPKGVVGFDCSGLVVAMYRQAGVDLAAQGIANTRSMAQKLPAISENQLQPGDLLVKAGSHVVIYLGDTNGDGKAEVLEATPPITKISDASKFLNNDDYVCRRVPLA